MRKIFGLVACLYTILVGSAWADQLSQPSGNVILTISGQIKNTNADSMSVFDMDMLKALPSVSYETSTLWTEGTKIFVGVPVKALLETVGANGTIIRASAINDYTVELPIDTLSDTTPMIAYEMDGAAMSRRQKGPLWIVYPFDSDPEFQSEVVYSRSIWQLDRLEIVE